MCLALICELFFCYSASAITKLSKGASGGAGKTPQTEKKETPQERLKRIMSKQLNKQSMTLLLHFTCIHDLDVAIKLVFISTVRKDTAAEIAKKREQERQRQEKLAEVGRYRRRSSSRSLSPSPPRYMKHPSH
jgi:splicing factor, arginine/serine-rich 16